MRVTKWIGLALCALGLLLGGLVAETVPSPVQANAAAQEGCIEQRALVVESADSNEPPPICCQQFTLSAADVHGEGGGGPTLPPQEQCCDQITSAAGLNSADSAPIQDPCCGQPTVTFPDAPLSAADSTPVLDPCGPPIFCGQPNLVVDELNSANGQPTFDPCCGQPDYTVTGPLGLNSANGQPTFDPCCGQPTVTFPGNVSAANGQPTFDPCCDGPVDGYPSQVNGPPVCDDNPCGVTPIFIGDGPPKQAAPLNVEADVEDPCCAAGPVQQPHGGLDLQSADVGPGPGGPGGPGVELCVPVCPIEVYDAGLQSADSRRDGPGGPRIPECIPICGTDGPPQQQLPLQSADSRSEGPGGPPCVPICAPGTPASNTATASPVELPPCVLPCGPVDLVGFGSPSDGRLSSANLGHDGPPAPSCVPPCLSDDAPVSATISSANMRRPDGPPPIQPCIPPCPNNEPNPQLPLESAGISGGYIILCDPCFDLGNTLFATADAASETPTTPTVEPVLVLDADCDEVPDDIDCDPNNDAIVNTSVDDADCDLVPTATDCNDADSSVTNTNTNDADCDLVPTATDCNDADSSVTNTNTNDADCDQIPTATDCNDADPTNLCFSIDDPYICGQGFQGSITGGSAPYNVSYTLVAVVGGATQSLPAFVVANSGPFTTPSGYIDHGTTTGTHDVTVSATDMANLTTSVSFRVNMQISCSTAQAPAEPGITDKQVEEILEIVNARNNPPVGETISELDAVTAAPAGVASSGGALALTGTASRMLAMFALVFLGFGMTFVGTDRLRQLLPSDDTED